MASICYLLLAAVVSQTKAFEFYAYFIGEDLPVTRNVSYFDDIFNAGVTELIFVGFSVSADTTITRTFSNENELLSARQAADTHGARVSLMIGGSLPFINGGPAAFSKFYGSANKMVEKYKFDGINFDWEFPSSTDEWNKYRDLMKGTKENVKKNGRNVNVSVAIGNSYALYKSVGLCGVVDKCLWMGYDNHNDPRGQSNIYWDKHMVNEWKNVQGLPSAKFALGVPLYGENGAGTQITYFKLVEMGADPKGKGSFKGYFFDSQPILQEKIDLCNNESLGGLMAWHLGSDLPPEDTRSLIYGIKQKLNPGP
ncbi:chitinase [Perkinsus olseni]|uniref:Chitinase n=1 Tax=Perkinsus olseni TaxID=32597 RepID=A0A7J6QHI2_PEROL|nr:chitinase [Perkinsus olseni]KAF4723470.1 chitinase [Perkinsus olseni]